MIKVKTSIKGNHVLSIWERLKILSLNAIDHIKMLNIYEGKISHIKTIFHSVYF